MKGVCVQIDRIAASASASNGSADQSSWPMPDCTSAQLTMPISGSSTKRHIATAETSLIA